MGYFDELGEYVQSRWDSSGRAHEALPDIACDGLEALPPPAELVEDVIRRLLDSEQDLDRQLAPAGTFGEPGITMHYGDEFVIDVYYWNNAAPAIHNHPFCGCFTILRGRSLHDVYRFDCREAVNEGVRFGELRAETLSLLEPGSAVPFSQIRYPLIHSLVHVTNPTVSMVIRSVRTVDYFRYFPPCIALTMSPSSDRLNRQLAMLQWLRSAGDPTYLDRARNFLRGADIEVAVRTLAALYHPEDNDILASAVREHHGEAADLILPALAQSIRLQLDNQLRDRYDSDEERMTLSIFMCAHNRSEVMRLMSEACPGVPLIDLINRLALFDDDDQEDLNRLLAGASTQRNWEDTPLRALAIE